MEFSRRRSTGSNARAAAVDRRGHGVAANSSTQSRYNRSVVHSLNFPQVGTSSSSFYGSTTRAGRLSDTWQPGQHIPFNVHVPDTPSHTGDVGGVQLESTSVVEVLQTLQSSMDGQFTQINSTLRKISERLDTLEDQQRSIEDKMEAGSISTPQSSCSESGSIRKRRTPVALQNRIHMVHNALDSDNQLRVNEPITSSHNVGVVQKITDDIGTEEFSKGLIREGCKTYRKTLSEKLKTISTPVKKKKQLRSLQQRCYERRSKAIKNTSEKENKYWSDITADMMSDEEKEGKIYIRHPPGYRSERLNRFIQKLDERLDSMPSRHARHARVLGSPVEKHVPAKAKAWMLKDDARSAGTQNQSFEEEGSDQDLLVLQMWMNLHQMIR